MFDPTPFFQTVVPLLASWVFIIYSTSNPEAWRAGKPLTKLTRIDYSRAYDAVRCDAAKSQVKKECVSKDEDTLPTKARIIQGNVNEHTAYTLPWEYYVMSKALQNEINFTKDGIEFRLQYAGGMSHDALSDWLTDVVGSFRDPVFDERDGANWDATMQEGTLRAEAAVYKACGLDVVEQYLKRCAGVNGKIFVKEGRIVQVIRYHTAWKRLSGDWNTSTGNTIISMMVVVVTILALRGHLRPTRVAALFMGDDYLGIYEYAHRPPLGPLKDELDRLDSMAGITPARALTFDVMKVSFISLGVWPTYAGNLVFVPHPAKQLNKLYWAVKHVPKKHQGAYAGELSRAFWPVYWGFPMMMQFLKRHFNTLTCDLTRYTDSLEYWYHGLARRAHNINWPLGFVSKYDLPFTATNFKWPEGRCAILHHPVVELMLRFELADPCDRF